MGTCSAVGAESASNRQRTHHSGRTRQGEPVEVRAHERAEWGAEHHDWSADRQEPPRVLLDPALPKLAVSKTDDGVDSHQDHRCRGRDLLIDPEQQRQHREGADVDPRAWKKESSPRQETRIGQSIGLQAPISIRCARAPPRAHPAACVGRHRAGKCLRRGQNQAQAKNTRDRGKDSTEHPCGKQGNLLPVHGNHPAEGTGCAPDHALRPLRDRLEGDPVLKACIGHAIRL